MKISHRLIGMSAGGALAMAGVGFVGLYGVHAIQQEVVTLTTRANPLKSSLQELQTGEERVMAGLRDLSRATDQSTIEAINLQIDKDLTLLQDIDRHLGEIDPALTIDLSGLIEAHSSVAEKVKSRLESTADFKQAARAARRALGEFEASVAQVGDGVGALATEAGNAAAKALLHVDQLVAQQRAAQKVNSLLKDIDVLLYATEALTSQFRAGPLRERLVAAVDAIDNQLPALQVAELQAVLPNTDALRNGFVDPATGLLALKVSMLGDGSGSQRAYRGKRKGLATMLSESGSALSGLIDALELDIVVSRMAIAAALEISSSPVGITAVSQRLAVDSRTLGAKLERLLLADSPGRLASVEFVVLETLEQASTLTSQLADALQAQELPDLLDAAVAVKEALGQTHESITVALLGLKRRMASNAELAAQLLVLKETLQVHREKAAERVSTINQDVNQVSASIQERVSLATWLIIGLSVVGVLLSIVISLLTVRSIMRRLREALAVADAVSRGQLDPVAHSAARDEVSLVIDAMRTMVATLDGSVRKIRTATGSVSAGAEVISSGNADLSTRTEAQAAQLSEAADTTGRISDSVRSGAAAAQEASALSLTASDVAREGRKAVENALQTMQQIETGANEISSITSVIDAIAFQTKILALNAAVEAGRAGESGRGFAIVAAEVGVLARKSKESVLQIREIIEANVQHVATGSRLVSEAAGRIEDVVAKVGDVAKLIGDVSTSNQSQVLEISQIDGSVGSLEKMTRQNAVLSEKTTAAARSLLEQSRALGESVSVFNLVEHQFDEAQPSGQKR